MSRTVVHDERGRGIAYLVNGLDTEFRTLAIGGGCPPLGATVNGDVP